jgi:hypothetical protein
MHETGGTGGETGANLHYWKLCEKPERPNCSPPQAAGFARAAKFRYNRASSLVPNQGQRIRQQPGG